MPRTKPGQTQFNVIVDSSTKDEFVEWLAEVHGDFFPLYRGLENVILTVTRLTAEQWEQVQKLAGVDGH